jgi:hypothetical protein
MLEEAEGCSLGRLVRQTDKIQEAKVQLFPPKYFEKEKFRTTKQYGTCSVFRNTEQYLLHVCAYSQKIPERVCAQ